MATPGATNAPASVPPSAPSSSNDATVQVDGTGAKPVLIPRCSTWFRLDAINPIEQRMLPEFFTSGGATSKTGQIYMKYRNYMVHSYRQQPHVYLTATACRRNLAGDACAILRVHEFLTHWGLINYNVPPHAMPPSIHPNYALKPDPTVSSSTRNGPLAVLTEDSRAQIKPQTWLCEACGMNAVEFELSQDAKLKAVGSNANGATASTTTASAANGHAKELPLGAFCLRPGSGLCGDCLLNGAYPEALDASDFVRVKAPAVWTEEETSRLLAAVSSSASSRSDEACDWNEIAARVKTKTAEECLLHFLEMSIVDKVHGVSTATEPSVLQRPFEYASAMNALVVDMASLVAGIDPFVAKAAARAAIQAVKQLHTMPVQKGDATAEASTIKAEAEAANPPAAVTTHEATANDADASAALADAAAAVANSAQAAGIASDAIKEEVEDVTMADDNTPITTAAAPASSEEHSVLVTKESVAVAREASGATTMALLATRANAIATETATGPVRDLVAQLLQNQLQQMELKMQQLSALETAVRAEKDQLARDRYQLYMDRLAFGQAKSDSSTAPMSEL